MKSRQQFSPTSGGSNVRGSENQDNVIENMHTGVAWTATLTAKKMRRGIPRKYNCSFTNNNYSVCLGAYNQQPTLYSVLICLFVLTIGTVTHINWKLRKWFLSFETCMSKGNSCYFYSFLPQIEYRYTGS